MSMKNFVKSVFAVAAIAGAQVFAQDAVPEVKEEGRSRLIPSMTLNVEYKSRYISDGFVVNPESMIFGSFDLGWDISDTNGIYVGIWGANDWNDYNEGTKGDHEGGVQYEPEEWDYYIGYWHEIGDIPAIESLTLDLSYTYWDYPHRTHWQCVGEQQNTIALDLTTGCFLKPGVTINWDSENEKIYCKFHVKYEKDIEDIKGLSFSTGLDLFWGNSHYVNAKGVKKSWVPAYNEDGDRDGYEDKPVGGAALTTLVWSAGFSYAVNDHFSFGPFASLSFALDHNVRDSWKSDHKSANSDSGCNTLWGFGGTLKF